jgi:hypothetical protein
MLILHWLLQIAIKTITLVITLPKLLNNLNIENVMEVILVREHLSLNETKDLHQYCFSF